MIIQPQVVLSWVLVEMSLRGRVEYLPIALVFVWHVPTVRCRIALQ